MTLLPPIKNGWSELTPRQKNDLVGNQLGMKPMTQCWLGYAGEMLLSTAFTEEQKSEAEAMKRIVSDYDWPDSLERFPSLKPEMKGKLEVIIERWHIRYADTPGGGWEVVEWLRDRGSVKIESVAGDQWRVAFDDGHPHHGRRVVAAPTMAEAACLVALRYASQFGNSSAPSAPSVLNS